MKIFIAIVLFWLLLIMSLEVVYADTIVVNDGGTTKVCTQVGSTIICH